MTSDQPSTEEEVLFAAHRHWAAMIPTALIVTVLISVLAILWYLPGMGVVPHSIFTLMLPLCLLIGWIVLLMVWTINHLNMIILTDRRVIYTEQLSLVSRTIHEWNIHDVRHVRVIVTNFLQTYFSYGNLEIETNRAGAPTLIEGMPDPEYISAVILRQDDRFEKLKETARKQQELLKFVSHEVKGHLTKSKAAFASIIEGDYGPVTAPLGSMAQDALADSQRGVETVMSILDGSEEKRDAMALSKQPFDLSATVQRLVEEFHSLAASKGISISLPVNESCVINGDEQKLARHVIRNLLDNAIRYTPKGSIEVTLTKNDDTARLSVLDTGVGIAGNDMHTLFTWGGHGEHSRNINAESTGYGLYIAKRIVDGHDGHIWAQSGGPGTGSRFIVELPLKKI